MNLACESKTAPPEYRIEQFKEAPQTDCLKPTPGSSLTSGGPGNRAAAPLFGEASGAIPRPCGRFSNDDEDGRSELAGGPGFEPGLSGSEPLVLPLNYPPSGAGAGAAAGRPAPFTTPPRKPTSGFWGDDLQVDAPQAFAPQRTRGTDLPPSNCFHLAG